MLIPTFQLLTEITKFLKTISTKSLVIWMEVSNIDKCPIVGQSNNLKILHVFSQNKCRVSTMGTRGKMKSQETKR